MVQILSCLGLVGVMAEDVQRLLKGSIDGGKMHSMCWALTTDVQQVCSEPGKDIPEEEGLSRVDRRQRFPYGSHGRVL